MAKLMGKYKLVVKPMVQLGKTIPFCSDAWEIGGSFIPLRERFARLFSFVIEDKIYVKKMVDHYGRTELFHLPLSAKAFEEF